MGQSPGYAANQGGGHQQECTDAVAEAHHRHDVPTVISTTDAQGPLLWRDSHLGCLAQLGDA